MIPEAVIAMLACARIGAVHSVVFGGYSAEAVADRNNDAQSKVLITADGGWRRGKVVPLKANVDAALAKSPSVEKCIVVNRCNTAIEMKPGRDLWWHDVVGGQSAECPATPFDSEHPLFVLYTSGSTGKPKGVVLSHRNLVAGADSVSQYLENRPEDRILSVLPLSFDYGLNQLTTAFRVGACAVLMNYLFPRDVIRAVRQEKISGLAAVPPLWVQLAQLC